jgi:hypothetical protein
MATLASEQGGRGAGLHIFDEGFRGAPKFDFMALRELVYLGDADEAAIVRLKVEAHAFLSVCGPMGDLLAVFDIPNWDGAVPAPAARREPSLVKAKLTKATSWPVNVASSRPEETSQKLGEAIESRRGQDLASGIDGVLGEQGFVS